MKKQDAVSTGKKQAEAIKRCLPSAAPFLRERVGAMAKAMDAERRIVEKATYDLRRRRLRGVKDA